MQITHDFNINLNTRFDYVGSDLLSEHNSSNIMLRRYVYGPGSDEPLVWYEGSGTTDRRFPLADERGSIIAITDASGTVTNINAYDEYGIPAASNVGRFGYTGQTWLPEVGLNYYKARMYSPTLGRFMQTDPIGYGDGINFYAYVGNDPVNATDPSGLAAANCPAEYFCPTAPRASNGYPLGFAIRTHNPSWAWADNRDDEMARRQDEQNTHGCGKTDEAQGCDDNLIVVTSLFVALNPVANAGKTPSPQDLAGLRIQVSRACGGLGQGTAECSESKAALVSGEQIYSKAFPLPPVPKFKTVRPSGSRVVFDGVGCGLGIAGSSTFVLGGFAAAACAFFANDAGNYIFGEVVPVRE